MNKENALRSIIQKMESQISQKGFKKSFGQQWFIKQKDKDFKVYYRLLAYNGFNYDTRSEGIMIEPFVGIQNNEVEMVYHQITTREIPINSLKTIGNIIADIIANPTGEYLNKNNELKIFFNELNPDSTAEILLKYFEDVASPYIEKYSNWKSLDEIFNTNIDKSTDHCKGAPDRSIRGVIVANLLKRNDVSELIIQHRKVIEEGNNENYINEFERLMNYKFI